MFNIVFAPGFTCIHQYSISVLERAVELETGWKVEELMTPVGGTRAMYVVWQARVTVLPPPSLRWPRSLHFSLLGDRVATSFHLVAFTMPLNRGAVASVNGKKGMKQGTLFSFFSKKDKTTTEDAPPEPSRLSSSLDTPSEAPSTSSTSKTASSSTLDKTSLSNSSSPSVQVKVGDMIEVYWNDDDAWYKAKVLKIKSQNPKYYIEYSIDGQSEWIDLSVESFRLLDSNAAGIRKRQILSNDDDEFSDEAEFVLGSSEDEGSVYKDDGKDDEEEVDEDDDQWMVTDDDEDEVAPTKKRKITNKVRKPIELKSKQARRSNDSSSSSLSALRDFAAGSGPVSVAPHSLSVGGKTPPTRGSFSSQTLSTPQQITPSTTASAAHLSSNSSSSANRMIDRSGVSTPMASQKTPSQFKDATSKPPMFEVGALNPACSHVHNHLPFLQNPRDAAGRTSDDPNYDPRTLQIVERDWIRITGKGMTDAVKQWWDLKAMYFDTVLLFKTGTFFFC